IGAIHIRREGVQPFTDKQIALLKTVADQAVIAIENVRLFQELEARTRELAESVGELRALGSVSQAVSSTLDLETVLATIVSHAVPLSGTHCAVRYYSGAHSSSRHLRSARIHWHAGAAHADAARLSIASFGPTSPRTADHGRLDRLATAVRRI